MSIYIYMITQNFAQQTELNDVDNVKEYKNIHFIVGSTLTFTGKTYLFTECKFIIKNFGKVVITCQEVYFSSDAIIIQGSGSMEINVATQNQPNIHFDIVDFNGSFEKISFNTTDQQYNSVSNAQDFSVLTCDIFHYCRRTNPLNQACRLITSNCPPPPVCAYPECIAVVSVYSELSSCQFSTNPPQWSTECP